MSKIIKYPDKLITMLMDRGDMAAAEILPKIHKYFPKYKNRLTLSRAHAVSTYYKSRGWYDNDKKKGNNSRKTAKFLDISLKDKKEIMEAALRFKEEGKTPTSIRDQLSTQFGNVILPKAQSLAKLITKFAESGAVLRRPRKNGGNSAGDSSFMVKVKGPGTELVREVPLEIATDIIQTILSLPPTGD